MHNDVLALARALVSNNVVKNTRVGIYGSNAPEWIEAMLATSATAAVCVPLYPSLASNATSYILTHSGMEVVFVQVSLGAKQ